WYTRLTRPSGSDAPPAGVTVTVSVTIGGPNQEYQTGPAVSEGVVAGFAGGGGAGMASSWAVRAAPPRPRKPPSPARARGLSSVMSPISPCRGSYHPSRAKFTSGSVAASASSCEVTAVSWSIALVPRLLLPTLPPGYAMTA